MTYKEETVNGYVKQLWLYLLISDQLHNSIYSINGFSYFSISVESESLLYRFKLMQLIVEMKNHWDEK